VAPIKSILHYCARQLLRLVLLYGGLDKSLHEVAGHFTLLVERIMDSAVVECLAACRPWVRALLARLLPGPAVPLLQRRFLVLDGSDIHAPSAVALADRGRGGPALALSMCYLYSIASFVTAA
jgi:hypothetical protein